MSLLSLLLWFVCLATESQLTKDKKMLECVALKFCKLMAPGGCVFKQTTLTGETIQDTQSLDESNNHTPTNQERLRQD
ncbi:hypothetical protein H5410_053000 [Solanum commersonii]|uniref:Uncharacterized protein n=1 Tax=Solanum commersonii TaxID=4109 RepID=A0A9J5X4P7_SOLCO|nr:hypothetical protein H5410_053000 [Solanum commersonii]